MYVTDRFFGQLWVRVQNLSKRSCLARRWELVDQDPRSIDPFINECSRRSTDLVANYHRDVLIAQIDESSVNSYLCTIAVSPIV